MQEHEHAEVEALVEAATGLMDKVHKLAQDEGIQFTTLAKKAHETRVLAVVAITGLILDVVLTFAMAFGGWQLKHLTNRLDVAQTTTRQKALCPLYQVFLDSESPAGRKAAPDPVKYDHAFKVIREGYSALECSKFIDSAGAGAPTP
jgi:hypothetical protein